jgi:hypothetical protein
MKALRAKLRLSAAEELENVEVVNRHTYSGPQDNTYLYIGRGTPLGNRWSYRDGTPAPYKVQTREEAVSRFNNWLSEQIEKGEGAVFNFIHELKERIASGEEIKLACSCTPELCHGDVVKATIELLIHTERHPDQTLEREELQLDVSSSQRLKSSPTATERQQTTALSARAEQAHAEVLAIDPIADDLTALYNVPEGLTRAEHAGRLNDLDQFVREAFERGATLTENVLSMPRDPDARPRDETKVTIGTEVHAINFVRGFIDDPKLAEEKGKLLFEIGHKACGQWIDSDGRLTVFNHIYTEIRQDESGAYRTNEQKAEVIDRVLAETARWAEPLPEPIADPTPEQLHEYTLSLAEENRAELEGNLVSPLHSDLREIQLEPQPSFYFDHLNSSSHGLATLGELAGFTFEPHVERTDLPDENQIYAEMYEAAIADSLEYATPEGDHFGAERENSTTVTLDASYDRINLAALPPQVPDTLSFETQSDLLGRVLPAVDAQLERGASKTDILNPLFENNRELEQLQLTTRVTETFARAGHPPSSEPVSRVDQLNGISSLRILLRVEYVEATKGFTREAIHFAKENYRVNPDWLRSQGELQKGEYQRILTSQKEERIAWLQSHPGEKLPTRAEITTINNIERVGHQLNAVITGLNPTRQEHAQALDQIQSRLASSKQTCETLLRNYAATEQISRDLAGEAVKFAEAVRATPEFQERKEALVTQCRDNSKVEQEWLVRENNVFFGGLNNLDGKTTSAHTEVQQTQVRSSNEIWAEILQLQEKLSGRGVDLEVLQHQAQSRGGVDLPLIRGIEELDGKFYPLDAFTGYYSAFGSENGFATREEAQTFIDNFSQERDPDEQQLLNLYAEYHSSQETKASETKSQFTKTVATQTTPTTTFPQTSTGRPGKICRLLSSNNTSYRENNHSPLTLST